MLANQIPKQKKCGLIMPISTIDGYPASHWADVLSIVREALLETEFSVELVSDSDEIGVIHKRIVQNIYDNEIVVCDVSARNPNVMFELGMRLAFDKPAIIIKDDKTSYSFDTAQIEHLEYPRELTYSLIQSFKLKLRDKVVATYEASKRSDYTTFLKHFGQFVVADIEQKKVGKDVYLLEAISELRKEVSSLGKTVHTRGALFGLDIRELRKEIEEKRSKTEIGMHDFLRAYFGNGNTPALCDIADTDSKVFATMLAQYLRSEYAPVIPRDPDEIKHALKSAAAILINKLYVEE